MKKIIAIVLYTMYALFAGALIVFGEQVSLGAINAAYTIINYADITDVTVDIDTDEPMLVAKTHYPKYETHGIFFGGAGLKFESLDPEILKVYSSGAVKLFGDFEGNEISARMRISSKNDPEFEKIVTFNFHRVYPDKFTAQFKVYGTSSRNAYVGVPMYAYSSVSSGQTYSVKDYEVIYDEEYFTYDESRDLLIPIKATGEGEYVTLSVRYANGATAETRTFRILPAPAAYGFDEIRFNSRPVAEIDGTHKKSFSISIFNEGKPVISDFSITLREEDKGKVSRGGTVSYSTPGYKELTVTLPDGTAKTVGFTIQNTLELPVIKDLKLNENGAIAIVGAEPVMLDYEFASDEVTYKTLKLEYDKKMISAKAASEIITITPKAAGTTTLKLIIDDGHQRLEKDYKIEISEDSSFSAKVKADLSTFVSKVMGHMTLFAVLAMFSINMFGYFERRNLILSFVGYVCSGLWLAALTEYAQTYIPRRSGTIRDVGIDMLGFAIGTVLAMAFIAFKRKFVDIKNEEISVEPILREKYRL